MTTERQSETADPREALYPLYMVATSIGDATYVQVGTKTERIASTYGIDAKGRLAKAARGGYGVFTVSGRRVDCWRTDCSLLREDPYWFANNSRSLVEAWSEAAPQVIAAAILAIWDVLRAIKEAGGEVPSRIKLHPRTIKALQELFADVLAGDQNIINSLKACGLRVRENRRYLPSYHPKSRGMGE